MIFTIVITIIFALDKRLSYDFPERNFYYNTHNYFKEILEKDILADSNINIIVNDQSLNSTYGWAFKSQIVLSFCINDDS